MAWEVEYTNEFETWWEGLAADEQEDVNAKVLLLQQFGPALKRPHTDVIASSRHSKWYDTVIPIADRLYDAQLDALWREGLIDG